MNGQDRESNAIEMSSFKKTSLTFLWWSELATWRTSMKLSCKHRLRIKSEWFRVTNSPIRLLSLETRSLAPILGRQWTKLVGQKSPIVQASTFLGIRVMSAWFKRPKPRPVSGNNLWRGAMTSPLITSQATWKELPMKPSSPRRRGHAQPACLWWHSKFPPHWTPHEVKWMLSLALPRREQYMSK